MLEASAEAAVRGTNGRIYVFGTTRSRSSAPTATVGIRGANIPTWREGLAAAMGSDNRIYVIGGSGGRNSHSIYNTVEAYNARARHLGERGGIEHAARVILPRPWVRTARSTPWAACTDRWNRCGATKDGNCNYEWWWNTGLAGEGYGPNFSMLPGSGLEGATVVITGTGLATNADVTAYWGTITGTQLATGSTNAFRRIEQPVDVPSAGRVTEGTTYT